MTSGQEMERVYSFNPEDHTRHWTVGHYIENSTLKFLTISSSEALTVPHRAAVTCQCYTHTDADGRPSQCDDYELLYSNYMSVLMCQ